MRFKMQNKSKLFFLIGKKGIGELVIWVIRCFLLIPIIFLLGIYANSFVVNNVDVTNAENEIIMSRFLYSPDGFLYIDSVILRPYPGIVDLSKFNSSRLEKMIIFKDNFLSAKFTLEYEDGSKNETFYFEESYNKYRQYVGIKGMVDGYIKKYNVNVFDAGGFRSAVLTVDLVMVRG
jgi:hypothetical protein